MQMIFSKHLQYKGGNVKEIRFALLLIVLALFKKSKIHSHYIFRN